VAKREVIDCDVCGEETKVPIHIDIPDGVEQEFGGHKVETYNKYMSKDLCPVCAARLFKYMLGHVKVDAEKHLSSGGWRYDKHLHPSENTNDAVFLVKKFFKEKVNPKP
jgi:hypothetical protein